MRIFLTLYLATLVLALAGLNAALQPMLDAFSKIATAL